MQMHITSATAGKSGEMKQVKVFDKGMLMAAAAIAQERNYNRRLDLNELAKLPGAYLFPVSFSMLHEHCDGKVVDPHVRAKIILNVGDNGEVHSGLLDVDMDLFNNLPMHEVPE